MKLRHPMGAAVLALIVLTTAPGTVHAQNAGTVTGQVTAAETGQPLAGVQVIVDGTTIGILTDASGRYRLTSVPVGARRLRAVFIGFGPVTKAVTVAEGATATVDFQLAQSAIELDGVVVTATGEQRKREIGNVVSTIPASELVKTETITNMADLLQGRSAGVQVLNSSGTTGMGSRIRIRGSNSISLSNEPLIYLDGIRLESSTNSISIGTGGQDVSRLNDINPEDIESIEIVKGPSAATLYGTEAANGVIRITTKKGQSGPANWNVYLESGVINDENDYPLNYAGLDSNSSRYDESCSLDRMARGLCNQTGLSAYTPLKDPQLSPFGTGARQQLGVSVSGGSERVNYYIAGEFEGEHSPYQLPDFYRPLLDSIAVPITDQVEHPNQIRKTTFRANVTAQVSENANVSFRTGYVSSDLNFVINDNSSFGLLPSGFFGGAFPNRPEEAWGFQTPGQLFGRTNRQEVERYTSSLNGNWSPLSWLDLRSIVGLDLTMRHDHTFNARDLQPGSLGSRDSDYRRIYQYSADLGATANFSLTDAISSKTSVGGQFFRNIFDGTNANGSDIVTGSRSIGNAAVNSASESTTESKSVGVFVEQQFGWRDRLFLTGAIRADDASAFGQDFDLIYYPKLSGSWMLSEESFFPDIGALDALRLRAAWGASGLQPGSNDAIRTLSANAITNPNDEVVSGVSIGSIGNATLKPERSSELEAGLDLDLIGGRVGVELTYYDKRTSDALVSRPLPPSLGASNSRLENLGGVQNRGWEAGLNAQLVNSDAVRWDASLSGSITKNELLELGEGIEPIGNTVRHVPGFPLGGRWDRPILGFSDTNGDGIIGRDEVQVGDTAVFIGAGLPEKQVTVTSNVTFFDRFRLYGLLDYRGGYYAFNNTEKFRCQFSVCQAFHDPNAPLWDQARAVAALLATGQRTNYGYVEDASFLKLREVSLTFFVPDGLASKFRARRMSLTVSGRNLATWTDYTGLDPEINSAGSGSNFGVSEFLTQPPVRYWTARINVNF